MRGCWCRCGAGPAATGGPAAQTLPAAGRAQRAHGPEAPSVAVGGRRPSRSRSPCRGPADSTRMEEDLASEAGGAAPYSAPSSGGPGPLDARAQAIARAWQAKYPEANGRWTNCCEDVAVDNSLTNFNSIQSLFAAQYIITRREPNWEARARSILAFVERNLIFTGPSNSTAPSTNNECSAGAGAAAAASGADAACDGLRLSGPAHLFDTERLLKPHRRTCQVRAPSPCALAHGPRATRRVTYTRGCGSQSERKNRDRVGRGGGQRRAVRARPLGLLGRPGLLRRGPSVILSLQYPLYGESL